METPFSIEDIIQQHTYPPLRQADTGVNVVTLQTWLKMLGFYSGPTGGRLDQPTAQALMAFRAKHISAVLVDSDTWQAMESLLKQRLPPNPQTIERLPFPRRKDYDSAVKYQKALYEGLKRFGFPIPPAAQPIQLRLTTDADGLGRLTNLPSGEYDLAIESLNPQPTGSAEIRLVDEAGQPLVATALLSGPGGEFSVRTQADGVGVLTGLPPGEYALSVKDTERDVYHTAAGSVELSLVDQAGQPVSAQVVLSSTLGEPDALQQAVKLFKAIAQGIDLYGNTNAENPLNSLSGELEETATNIEAWQHFSNTWGTFYGAPWMGVLLNPGDHPIFGSGSYQTVQALYKRGSDYLRASQSETQLLERLAAPIMVERLSNEPGGTQVEDVTPGAPFSIEDIIQQHTYPPLRQADTGINVVTLQIWLKMLGFYSGPTGGRLDQPTAQALMAFRAKHISAVLVDSDTWQAMENLLKQRLPPNPHTIERLPFPRRKDYDSQVKYQKALYEGLKRFGFPIPPAAQPIQLRLTTDTDGLGRLTNLPSGEYDLTIESLNPQLTGSAEIRLVDEAGQPLVATALLSGPGGEFSVRTQADGVGVLTGLPPGEYALSVKDTERDVYHTAAGSVELSLVDQAGQPVSAQVVLSSTLGEPDALQQAVKLFKAIAQGIDLYENQLPDSLSGKLEETAANIEAWQHFSNTWGTFYGAPWMGILLNPGDHPIFASGSYQTVQALYKTGSDYLRASQSEAQLLERLAAPIVIEHLANELGGIEAALFVKHEYDALIDHVKALLYTAIMGRVLNTEERRITEQFIEE